MTTSLSPIHIGQHVIDFPVLLAPMAGVSDQPFRRLCMQQGAGMAVSEMTHANPKLRDSKKSRTRLNLTGEIGIKSVQIVGSEPDQLAEFAKWNADRGAEIIDINMGCPAKKVCKKAAGSALLADPKLVETILHAVVDAVEVPVTLKIRTGTDKQNINAIQIARIAENAGIQMLTIHGRTRACRFLGEAEYDTIAEVKANCQIPIIANGDITTTSDASMVFKKTGADGIMIGRGAQGNPWLFNAFKTVFSNDKSVAEKPSYEADILSHIRAIHAWYGDDLGVKMARKHINWYLQQEIDLEARPEICKIPDSKTQICALENHLKKYPRSVFCQS